MDTLTSHLSDRLKSLRQESGWSLDQLADKSAVSRATLSRLESGQVSPTAVVLGKLCAVYGLSMSRLMQMIEDRFEAHVPRDDQALWRDPESGFVRRAVSPPAPGLNGEVIEGTLPAGAHLAYDAPVKAGQDHHLILLEGALSLILNGATHALKPGDCLRYRLTGPSAFVTPDTCGARYLLVLI